MATTVTDKASQKAVVLVDKGMHGWPEKQYKLFVIIFFINWRSMSHPRDEFKDDAVEALVD